MSESNSTVRRPRVPIIVLVAGLVLPTCLGCATHGSAVDPAREMASPAPPSFNFALAAELLAFAEDDQRYERMAMNRDPESREPGFFERKEALQRERADRCKTILAEHGYPSIDVVGPEAASAFWVLVQHADHDVAFQEEVLAAMAPLAAQGQAEGSEFAYLTDRVRINTGRRQLYGTQLAYDHARARPYPKPLERADEVDVRRAAIGMEPLREYLNGVAEMHFAMNRDVFVAEGIESAWAYPPDFDDWN